MMHQNVPAVRNGIEAAFETLEGKGYSCHMDFWCCSTCGWYAISEEAPGAEDKAVFFHEQDAESLEGSGQVYLAWSGDAEEIRNALEEQGLAVEHDGSEATRILVKLPIHN